MAQPSNTYATNDMVGIREDLADAIFNISPVDTPFLSSVSEASASNTLHEWQTDSLAAAAENAVIEGDEASTDASTATTRLGNYTQISDKVARVTGTATSVNTAGRANEMDYQMLKRGRELKRDMETVLLANTARNAGSDSVARRCAGVPAWIATNESTSGTAPTGDGTDTRTDGTQRAFTEDQLKTVMKSIFDAGGAPNMIMVGAFNRQIVSSFGAGTKFQKVEDDKLHTSFDVYESDFGDLRIVPNRFQRARDAHVLQTDMWAVGYLPGRKLAEHPLAKTGDTERKQILSEYTLECRQEAANGIIADLTTS